MAVSAALTDTNILITKKLGGALHKETHQQVRGRDLVLYSCEPPTLMVSPTGVSRVPLGMKLSPCPSGPAPVTCKGAGDLLFAEQQHQKQGCR